jgi:sugar phosphate isomerase/epimerase
VTGPNDIVLAGIGDEAGTSIEEQLAAIDRLGWSAIELRTVDGVALAEVSDRRFEHIAAAVDEAAVDVVCIDSRIAGWGRPITSSFELDRRELLDLVPRARQLGCAYLRIMSYPNDGLADTDWRQEVFRRLRELAAIARDGGVVLLHENCAGWAGRDARSTVRLLEAVDSPSLKLLFDLGNGLAYGYPSRPFLQDVVPWIEHVHVKDGIVEDGEVRWTWPGDGNAEVAACLEVLLAAGYRNALAIEPHLSVIPHAGVDRPSADLFVRHGQVAEALVRRCAQGAGR